MATLVFDIETIGEDWNALDSLTQHTLTRWIDRAHHSESERAILRRDIEEGLGFSPLTGEIIAIGLYDVERKQGVVYYRDDTREEEGSVGDFVLKTRSERDMLVDFWDGAQQYDTFVTFNGRGFDVPFLNIRSAIQGIRPSCDLMAGRYLSQQKNVFHIDLQDQLTYYGAMGRRPSLHLFCRAFGIESPKTDGVMGDDVAELFGQKKFRDIAEYNARDVIATTALYEKWRTHLAPPNFLNRLDF